MADSPENKKAEAEVVKAPAPVIFLLKNVVRGRANRTARASQPGRMSFVQQLAGGTIKVRRARPARIAEAALIANIEEIKKAVAQNKIVVTTLSGRVLNLETLNAAPAPAEKPLPNPPLDSAKNDKNEGIGYDVPPTPEGTTMNAPLPELLKGTQVEEPTQEPPVPSDLPPVVEAPAPAPEVEAPAPLHTEKAEAPTKSEESHKHSKGKGKRG